MRQGKCRRHRGRAQSHATWCWGHVFETREFWDSVLDVYPVNKRPFLVIRSETLGADEED